MDRFNVYKKAFGETIAKFLRASFIYYDEIDPKEVIDILIQKFPIKQTRKKLIPLLEKEINLLFGNKNTILFNSGKTMNDLADEAGYEFIVSDKLADAQSLFSKYYKDDELICSLKNESKRFQESYIAFLKKKNIDKIKRSDKPHYRDEYSTSLLCLQISKKANTLKCISRYNHSVSIPDFVYKNLDDIHKGMHIAFYEYFGLYVSMPKNDLPINVVEHNGQYFYCSGEENGNYWGDSFVIKSDDTLIILNEDQFMIEGTVYEKDGEFNCYYRGLGLPKVLRVCRIDKKRLKLYLEYEKTMLLTLDDECFITELQSDVEKIEDDILCYNEELKNISLPNVIEIGNYFLYSNKALTNISLPNVTNIGNDFLYSNKILTNISLPKVAHIGICFLYNNENLTYISLDNITHIRENFLNYNDKLISILLPNVIEIERYFLYFNNSLTNILLPNVKHISQYFLHKNKKPHIQEFKQKNKHLFE